MHSSLAESLVVAQCERRRQLAEKSPIVPGAGINHGRSCQRVVCPLYSHVEFLQPKQTFIGLCCSIFDLCSV